MDPPIARLTTCGQLRKPPESSPPGVAFAKSAQGADAGESAEFRGDRQERLGRESSGHDCGNYCWKGDAKVKTLNPVVVLPKRSKDSTEHDKENCGNDINYDAIWQIGCRCFLG